MHPCSDSDSSQSDDSSFEEPYTQALGHIHASTKNTLEDSEDEREKNRRFFNPTSPERKQNHSSSPKSKEPIRQGDVISYYHPMFRWGDVRGKRTATVLSVDPRRTPILVLDNGEVLPQDTRIQRIKIPFSRSTKILGKGGKRRKVKETVLVDHPGLFRFIEDFNLKLRNGDIGVDAGIQIESKWIKNIIKNNNKSINEQARLLAGDLEESSSTSSSGTSIHSSSSSSSSSSLLIVSPPRKNVSSEKSSARNAYVSKTISCTSTASVQSNNSCVSSTSKPQQKRSTETPSTQLSKKTQRMTLSTFNAGNRKKGGKTEDDMANFLSTKTLSDSNRIDFEREKFSFQMTQSSIIENGKLDLETRRFQQETKRNEQVDKVTIGKLELETKVAIGTLELEQKKMAIQEASCQQELLFKQYEFNQKLQRDHINYCVTLVKEGLYESVGDALDVFPLPKFDGK